MTDHVALLIICMQFTAVMILPVQQFTKKIFLLEKEAGK